MSKKITNKIIIALLVILLFNFIFAPIKANAFSVTSIISKPIVLFGMAIVDEFNLLLTVLLGDNEESAQEFMDALDSDDGKAILSEEGNYFIDPSKIFAGKIPMLNANIFEAADETSAWVSGDSLVVTLKKVVAGTYEMLRNLCAIVMLVLLIYTGIRIVLASNSANERAKWQMILLDWVKALALIIFVHVIMIGVFWISDKLVEAISLATNSGNSFIVTVRYAIFDEMDNWNGASLTIWTLFGMYAYLTYLTVIFAIAYLKRLMYVILLIIIAPVVAVMYALGGQQKQIFARWLKEYIMAVLIQPYHMLIYFILLSMPLNIIGAAEEGFSATNFFTGNNLFQAIYALVAMSFIRPAERMFRDMFGFNMGVAREASFDSGKATAKKAVDVTKEVVKTGVMIAGAVATGGATLAAGGAAAGETAGAAAEAGAEATATATAGETLGAEEAAETLEGTHSEWSFDSNDEYTNDYSNGDYDILDEDSTTSTQSGTTFDGNIEYSNSYNDSFEEENNKDINEDINEDNKQDSKEDERNQLNAATLDTLNVNTLNADAISGENIAANGVDAQGIETQDIDADDVDDEDADEEDDDDGIDENGIPNAGKDKKMSRLDRLAYALTYDNLGTDINNIKNGASQKLKDKRNERRIEKGKEPIEKSLSERFRSKIENSDNKLAGLGRVGLAGYDRIKRFKDSEEGAEQLKKLHSSFSELQGTMYLGGQTPGDIGAFRGMLLDHKIEKNKGKVEEQTKLFVENKNNIQFMKDAHNLKDDQYSSADEKAKKKLEKASQFVKYGVTDVGTADKLLTYKEEHGVSYKQAIDDYIKSGENKRAGIQQTAVDRFVNNKEKYGELEGMVIESRAAREGVTTTEIRNQIQTNPVIREQIRQETVREVQAAAPHLVSGTASSANDVILMKRMREELGKIAKPGADATKMAEKTEKIIRAAIKENMGTIKIPGSDTNKSAQKLEEFCNKEKTRREAAHNEKDPNVSSLPSGGNRGNTSNGGNA